MRIAIGLSVLLCSHLGAQEASEPPAGGALVGIVDELETFGCDDVEGEFVVLLKPGMGTLVMAAREFPGSQRIGAIEGERMRFSYPGLRVREMEVRSKVSHPAQQPLWGTLDRGLGVEGRLGCFSFDSSALSEGFGESVRRLVEEVYLAVPQAVLDGREAPRISDRTVALEVTHPAHPAKRVEGQEAVAMEFRWSESSPAYRLLPVILDAEANEVLLLVSPEDTAVDPAWTRAAIHVEIGPVARSIPATDPELEVSVAGIQENDSKP